MSPQNRYLIQGIFFGPQSYGSQCWSVITAPASRFLTSSWATPTHFESLLRTSVASVRQPPSLLTLPTSRKQVGPRAWELGRAEDEESKQGGGISGTTARPFLVLSATISKTEGFAQRDFSEAPKFTQPLADCTTVTGYDTQLFCCVRASPKVSESSVGWLCHTAPCSCPNLHYVEEQSNPSPTPPTAG